MHYFADKPVGPSLKRGCQNAWNPPSSITDVRKSLFLLIVMLFSSQLQAVELKRIEVQESNNYRLSGAYKRMLLPERLDSGEYVALRQYADLRLKTRLRDELDNIYTLAAWVHRRWRHDPYGMAPPQASYF